MFRPPPSSPPPGKPAVPVRKAAAASGKTAAPASAAPAAEGFTANPLLAATPERGWRDYVLRLDGYRRNRHMLLARLSQLRPDNRREKHVQQALGTFEALIRAEKVKPFTLSNNDLTFFYKSDVQDLVDSALVKLRFLFNDDPLLIAESRTSGAPVFIQKFSLEKDYDALLALAEDRLTSEQHRRMMEQANSFSEIRDKAKPTGTPLSPRLLHRLEEQLSRSDLSNMMRRQTVCALVGKAPPQPLFRELYISLSAVREALVPEIDITSDPWLRQHLTAILDRRVLFLLNQRDDKTLQTDFSVNLNVESVLLEEFLDFDEVCRAPMRAGIVVELQMMDIFSDLGAYLFARDYLHQRGYRVLIDGCKIQSLPFIDLSRIGADLLKVMWDPAIAQGVLPDGSSFADFVRRCGPTRVILCHCDSAEAIGHGQAYGIQLFQGHFVERLFSAEARRNPSVNRWR